MIESSPFPDRQQTIYRDGDGPLILVLPSIGRGNDELAPFARVLASRGFKVLRPEPRGIGSAPWPQDVTLRDMADEVASLVRDEGSGPAIVAGHAFGNWSARMAAVRHPHLIAGVVLLAAAARQWPKSIIADVELCSDTAAPVEQRLSSLKRVFFASGNDASAWLDGWHPDLLDRQRAAGAAVDQAEWWGAGDAPLLDVIAEEDPFRPRDTWDELKDSFPGRCDRVTVIGASHALPFERPRECADAVASWIASTNPSGRSVKPTIR